jgi:sugar lactone lactonase YvrE
LGWIGGGLDGWQTSSGSTSASDYQSFNTPTGICLDSSGNIYVADFNNNRICKWSNSGNAIGWIGGGSDGWQTGSTISSGSDYRSFMQPCGVFVDASGNIYIADLNNDRVSKWDAGGNAVGWIGNSQNGWQTGSTIAFNPDYQSFSGPSGICLDVGGNIIVVDSRNGRISKWSGTGNAIGWIGGGANGWQTSYGAIPNSDFQSFMAPWKVFVDSSGNIFVADSTNHRISFWNGLGEAVGWIGGGSSGWSTSTGTTSGVDYQSFNEPNGVFVDSSGNIYIADFNNHRISKWQ